MPRLQLLFCAAVWTAVNGALASSQATQRLAAWVTGSGGDVSRVAIRDVDGIRGVAIGAEKISPLETEFMVVPAALALSDDLDELINRSPLAEKLGRASLNLLQPDAHLALRLLHEKSLGQNSPWADYISLLPDHVHVARHLSDEALLACRSDFLLKQAMLARNYASGVHSTLLRLVGSEDANEGAVSPVGFSVDELGWALDMVHSRSFSVDAGVRGLRRYMVPLIDMLNHSPEAGCAFTYDDTDEPPSFVVELPEGKGLEPPASGEQLWLDYGAQTSEELWLMYGFVPSRPSPHDRVSLLGAYGSADLEGMLGDEAMLEEKRALLASCRYDPPREFELTGRSVDPGVISALRLIFLSPGELENVCSGNWNRPLLHAPVSFANERGVAQALKARLLGLLAVDGTTLAEDREQLAFLGGAVDAAAARKDGKDDAEKGEEALEASTKSSSVFDLLDTIEAEEEAEEAAAEEAVEEAMRREEMRCAVQLRANRKTLLTECVALLDGFLRDLERAEAKGDDVKVPNLHDAFDDYMPNIRLT